MIDNLFSLPEGYDKSIIHSQKAWVETDVTYQIAINSKTGKQLSRQIYPVVGEWIDVIKMDRKKKKS